MGRAGGFCCSQSRCAAWCSTGHRSSSAQVAISSAPNRPSSNRIGCATPMSRRLAASSRVSTAKPSAAASARRARESPCPYALALPTANTRAAPAWLRATRRLCAIAPIEIRALIGRRNLVGTWLRQRFEARVFAEEGQPHRADRAVTLLADDAFGRPLVLRVRIVDRVAVDEQDDVRILFDGARFAQVGHHRALVGTLLQAAVQLRQRDHWHMELLRQALERTRDF